MEVLFSDLDGTLVHYPKEFNEYAEIIAEDDANNTATIKYKHTGEERECVVLSSLTGGKAYLSKRTIQLVGDLRNLGVCFVIISGARTSTYLNRGPFLPNADFEFFENGGRKLHRGQLDPTWTDQFSDQIGRIDDRIKILPELPAPQNREGTLWNLYTELLQEGWKLDARDYTTNFRVDVAKTVGKSAEHYERQVRPLLAERGLSTSFNLGKADIYPAASGKANAAKHILQLCGWTPAVAVAMFDDDNDLELGALCNVSFLPGVTHPNVLSALERNPSWVLTKGRGFLGTEAALETIISMRKAMKDSAESVTVDEKVPLAYAR